MDIEISKDLQHYKEKFVMGLTFKQFAFSVLSLGTGAGVILLLQDKIGITLSCYAATPIVVPIALTGFYSYNGLSFWQVVRKMIKFTFFNRTLLYSSTENIGEIKQEMEKELKSKKKNKEVLKSGIPREEEFETMKKRAKRILLGTLGVMIAVAGVCAYQYFTHKN